MALRGQTLCAEWLFVHWRERVQRSYKWNVEHDVGNLAGVCGSTPAAFVNNAFEATREVREAQVRGRQDRSHQ